MSRGTATNTIGRRMERLSEAITRWAGSTVGFTCALAVVLLWAALGPLFHFSDTWQLVINTGTTVVTFLMVFLLQRSQNKHAMAIHLKLNEIVAAMEGASNRLVDAEDFSEKELETRARGAGEKGSQRHRVALDRRSTPAPFGETRAARPPRGLEWARHGRRRIVRHHLHD